MASSHCVIDGLVLIPWCDCTLCARNERGGAKTSPWGPVLLRIACPCHNADSLPAAGVPVHPYMAVFKEPVYPFILCSVKLAQEWGGLEAGTVARQAEMAAAERLTAPPGTCDPNLAAAVLRKHGTRYLGIGYVDEQMLNGLHGLREVRRVLPLYYPRTTVPYG